MKKQFFSLVAAIVCATATYAQSSLVATLSHNGGISVFHGATSLKQAMEAAADGDIITLASGRYDATTIDKAVTLRGAGMEVDAEQGTFPTQIVGSFDIKIPDETTERLTIEGIYNDNSIIIYGTLNNAMLQKCKLNIVKYYTESSTKVNFLTCMHCKITGAICFPLVCSANFINSYIIHPNNYAGGNLEFTNCYVFFDTSEVKNSLFTNCLIKLADIYGINSTNMVTYCVGTQKNDNNPFINVSNQTNTVLTQDQFNALFKTDGKFYELTDEAKTKYLGNDGKEVGLYGGNLPFSERILSPQITKCDVAPKTTTDGKLSVDIEVKAAE